MADVLLDNNETKTGGSSSIVIECNKLRNEILVEASVDTCFPQGCQFSPDGLCVLTAQGHELVLYNIPLDERSKDDDGPTKVKWQAALTCPAGDSVRAYAWYPHMNSNDPATCCFVGSARDQPVHLYDAYTGMVRATYRPYNRLDEMESPTALCFASNGQQLVTGGFRSDRMLHLFDLNRPGRDSTMVLKLGNTRRSKDGQKGLVSALAVAPVQQNLLAVGTYSPGSIYLYDLRTQASPVSEVVIGGTCVVGHGNSHSRKRKHFIDPDDGGGLLNFTAAKVQWYQSRARGGVTQVEFSSDEQSLFSSSRRSNAVLQWDLRKLSSSSFCPGIASFETCSNTNQRLEFQLDGEDRLFVGGHDCCIRVYNRKTQGGSLLAKFGGYQDAVNGLSLHSFDGKKLVAAAVGSRHFPRDDDWDQDCPYDDADKATAGWLRLSELKN